MDTPPPDPAMTRPDPPKQPIPPKRLPPLRPKRDYAAEEEAERRLMAALGQLRRGQLTEAETAVRALLAERPTNGAAQELLGDIEEVRGNWPGAIAAYQSALAQEPGRATAETKIGKAVLRQSEIERQKTLGVAYASADTSLIRRTGGERSGWLIVAGSAICPGLGQIVQGQTIKGGILVGVFVLGLGLLALLPHGGPGVSYFTPAFWLVTALLAGDWLYAVADAAAGSREIS